MGYYAAGDPGLFDFFEKAAGSIFSAGSRSMGMGEWKAKPGQLSFGRVLATVKPIASLIPGAGGLVDLAEQAGSLLSFAPGMESDYQDVASMTSDLGYPDRDEDVPPYGPDPGWVDEDLFGGAGVPEMPATLSAPQATAHGASGGYFPPPGRVKF